ncbi:MAG: hypothetical protein SFV81_25430, partial [Pirellulaceae bacterium]|nr:hypothetical protein [Pirellulaceae bacterium]
RGHQNSTSRVIAFSVIAFGLCLAVCGCKPEAAPKPAENKPKVDAVPQAEVESATVEENSPKRTPAESESPMAAEPTTAATESAAPPAMTAPAEPPQTWTSQRIVALAANGPLVIDMSVNVGGKSLNEAAEAATLRATAKVREDMEQPWQWQKLIDHPLVRSGWLGNLVPEEEQREELLKMYNTDGDEEVDEDELLVFLTRGLARGDALRFTDLRVTPSGNSSSMPWEKLDANRDATLDSSEIENLQNVVRSQDLNADGVVTIAEIQSVRAEDSNASMGMKSMLIAADSALVLATNQKPRKAADTILQHYTSLGNMTREEWSGWNDKRWNSFDTNGDQEISVAEFESITTIAPDLEIKIQFQVGSNDPPKITATVLNESELEWASRLATAGQATGTSMTLGINVTDSYAAANKAALRAQLAAVLTNAQLEAAVRNQLQLKEGAFDILDADNDDKLSDSEFENAWDWLTAIRASRIQTRWMLAESAWFRMADADADGRLTEVEVQKLPMFLARLDRDRDGVVSPTEIPLTVRFEIARTDTILNLGALGQPEDTRVERGWFAASDSNNDNSVSKAEFLGTVEDFQSYDTDNDGFISATEAYKSPSARVQ